MNDSICCGVGVKVLGSGFQRGDPMKSMTLALGLWDRPRAPGSGYWETRSKRPRLKTHDGEEPWNGVDRPQQA